MSEDLKLAESANLLNEIELQEDDLELLEGEAVAPRTPDTRALPVLAVIGRPNVGKSTLLTEFWGDAQR